MKRMKVPVILDVDSDLKSEVEKPARDMDEEYVPFIPMSTRILMKQTYELPASKCDAHPHMDPTESTYQKVHQQFTSNNNVRKVIDTTTCTHEATCEIMDKNYDGEDCSSAMPNTPPVHQVCDDHCETIAATGNAEKPVSAEVMKIVDTKTERCSVTNTMKICESNTGIKVDTDMTTTGDTVANVKADAVAAMWHGNTKADATSLSNNESMITNTDTTDTGTPNEKDNPGGIRVDKSREGSREMNFQVEKVKFEDPPPKEKGESEFFADDDEEVYQVNDESLCSKELELLARIKGSCREMR